MMRKFADFLGDLRGSLEVFRYPVLDLVERYGENYENHVLFIMGNLEKFARTQGETLVDALNFYARYVMQVAENRLGPKAALQADAIPRGGRLDVEYLYALTLSTALNRSRYELFLDYRRTFEEYSRGQGSLLEIGAGNCLDAAFASSLGKVRAYEKNELSRLWHDILGLDGLVDLRIEIYDFDEYLAYDFVTMIEFLEHIENPIKCLEDAARVLKDGGLAYLTFAIRMPQIDHLFDFKSIQECRDMLTEANFVVIHEQCLIDTYIPFDESERWLLAEDHRQAVIYCCLVRKPQEEELSSLLKGFVENLE